MIPAFIVNQKSHIIYGIVIILIASVAYHFFKKDPEVITKTLTQVKTVEKIVTQKKIVYLDRTITTHKKNGDVIIEVDHEHDQISTQSKTDSKNIVTQKTVQSFMKNYSIEAMFPISSINPLDTEISAGVRVFSFPVFAVIGTTGHIDKILVGLRLEF